MKKDYSIKSQIWKKSFFIFVLAILILGGRVSISAQTQPITMAMEAPTSPFSVRQPERGI